MVFQEQPMNVAYQQKFPFLYKKKLKCNKRVQRQLGKEYIVNISRQGKDAFIPTNSNLRRLGLGHFQTTCIQIFLLRKALYKDIENIQIMFFKNDVTFNYLMIIY